MRGLGLLLLAAALGLLLTGTASATVFHIVRQGDTVNSLASEYYGDAKRAQIIRAANHLPFDEEPLLSVGEPLVIPESARRVVKAGESWTDLARLELGTPERAWYLAEVNGRTAERQPEPGQIVDIPYMMPLALTEGLAATVERFFPDQSSRDRLTTARLLLKLNPGLRPRGMARGTRIIIPMTDLSLLPEKRAALDQALASRRSEADQAQQTEANAQLEQLPTLLGQGSFVEVVLLAGRLSGDTELTEAQRVTLHRYLGQALFALDRADLAEAQFEALLELQPDFQFDQVTTSPAILELLERVRHGRGQQGRGERREPVNRR